MKYRIFLTNDGWHIQEKNDDNGRWFNIGRKKPYGTMTEAYTNLQSEAFKVK